MYTTKPQSKNALNEEAIDIWTKYRPMSSINFSDIVDDRTIYDQTRTETTFNSSQISRCSSAWLNEYDKNEAVFDPDTVSVDDILGNSIVHEIRHLSQSRQGASNTTIRNSLPYARSQFGLYNHDISCASADFRPAEEMQEQLKKDEKEWEQEYADIPQTIGDSMSTPTSTFEKSHKEIKIPGHLANMTDFSVAYLCNSSSLNTDMSIGKYFSDRCQDVREIIPTTSPTKHSPVALVLNSLQCAEMDSGKYSQVSSSCYADDESSAKTETKISSATYDKGMSVTSESAIALLENDAESQGSLASNLYGNKSKALTKSNIQLLEKTLNEQVQTNNKLIGQKPSINQEYKKYGQYECDKNYGNDFQIGMNSTEIGDSTMSMDTLSGGDLMTSTDKTIGSSCSPIKSQIRKELVTDKRERPENQNNMNVSNVQNYNDVVENPLSHKENTESEQNKMTRMPLRSLRQTRQKPEEPLDDVSSIMLSNLRIYSPKRERSKSPVLVRKCDTDFNPSLREPYSSEERRRYTVQNRSPDMKLSLPNYGLQGIRSSYQGAISLDKRCNSQLSTHSEFTQNDGKFPLKSNTSELVWECVKLRKSVTKSFVIKNISEKKLSLKIIVIGPGFQCNIDSDLIILQGNECRTIGITFCPTVIGKAIGKIVFRPTKNWPDETERSVNLWAYGGSTVLQLRGIERGPVGCAYIQLGETNSITSTTLKRSFTIYNKGPLNGVATIFIKSKTNQCIDENYIIIEPKKCVIRPDCSTIINITYKLRRKDLERLREKSCDVLTVCTLEVIFGSEPNRQRISSMLTRRGNIPPTYKRLEFLVNEFPVAGNEHFRDFREHIDNVSDLFGCFKTSEIAITINRTNLDETQDGDLSGMDESVLFRTMIEAPQP